MRLYLLLSFSLNALCYLFSSFHDHKDDLRKRLSYTTHKLEMVETEFDSTRQYLETELRRAQEELEKFTEKLRRCVCLRAWLYEMAAFLFMHFVAQLSFPGFSLRRAIFGT